VTKALSINLVRTKVNILDEFIKWALTIGRGLVIAVEIVALFTFLYRFTLDRQIIDTREKIKQQQAIVSYLKDREDKYRNLQQRLLASETLSVMAPAETKIINDVVSMVPPEVNLKSLSLSDTSLNISVGAQSINSLTDFINSLKRYKEINTININRVQNKASESSISVDISCTLKTNEKN